MAGDGDQRYLSCRVQAYFYHPFSVLDTLQQPDYADYSFDFAKPFDTAFAKPSQNSMNLGLHLSKIATSGLLSTVNDTLLRKECFTNTVCYQHSVLPTQYVTNTLLRKGEECLGRKS